MTKAPLNPLAQLLAPKGDSSSSRRLAKARAANQQSADSFSRHLAALSTTREAAKPSRPAEASEVRRVRRTRQIQRRRPVSRAEQPPSRSAANADKGDDRGGERADRSDQRRDQRSETRARAHEPLNLFNPAVSAFAGGASPFGDPAAAFGQAINQEPSFGDQGFGEPPVTASFSAAAAVHLDGLSGEQLSEAARILADHATGENGLTASIEGEGNSTTNAHFDGAETTADLQNVMAAEGMPAPVPGTMVAEGSVAAEGSQLTESLPARLRTMPTDRLLAADSVPVAPKGVPLAEGFTSAEGFMSAEGSFPTEGSTSAEGSPLAEPASARQGPGSPLAEGLKPDLRAIASADQGGTRPQLDATNSADTIESAMLADDQVQDQLSQQVRQMLATPADQSGIAKVVAAQRFRQLGQEAQQDAELTAEADEAFKTGLTSGKPATRRSTLSAAAPALAGRGVEAPSPASAPTTVSPEAPTGRFMTGGRGGEGQPLAELGRASGQEASAPTRGELSPALKQSILSHSIRLAQGGGTAAVTMQAGSHGPLGITVAVGGGTVDIQLATADDELSDTLTTESPALMEALRKQLPGQDIAIKVTPTEDSQLLSSDASPDDAEARSQAGSRDQDSGQSSQGQPQARNESRAESRTETIARDRYRNQGQNHQGVLYQRV